MKRKIYKLWWIVLSSRPWRDTWPKAQNHVAKPGFQWVEDNAFHQGKFVID